MFATELYSFVFILGEERLCTYPDTPHIVGIYRYFETDFQAMWKQNFQEEKRKQGVQFMFHIGKKVQNQELLF